MGWYRSFYAKVRKITLTQKQKFQFVECKVHLLEQYSNVISWASRNVTNLCSRFSNSRLFARKGFPTHSQKKKVEPNLHIYTNIYPAWDSADCFREKILRLRVI